MDKRHERTLDKYGNVRSGVSVTVYLHGTTQLAELYADDETTALANPLTSDSEGYFGFCAADGYYDYLLQGEGWERTISKVVLADTTGIVPQAPTGSYVIASDALVLGTPRSGSVAPVGQYPAAGLIVDVEATTDGDGVVLLELFDDAALAIRRYSREIDLDAPAYEDVPAWCEPQGAAGELWYRLSRISGSGAVGATFKIINSAQDYGGSASQGELELLSTGGLQFVDGKLAMKLKTGGGHETTADGLAHSTGAGLVDTTSDQTVGGKKVFTVGIASTPAATAGPPTSGTWSQGHRYLDSDLAWWLCVSAGTPGTWAFDGHYWQELSAQAVQIAPGSYGDLAIPTKGRRGVIRKALVYGGEGSLVGGVPSWTVGDADIPLRIDIYPTSGRVGRDRIDHVLAMARCTTIASAITGGTTDDVACDNLDIAGPGDLVKLHDVSAGTYERGLVQIRDVGDGLFDLSDTIVASYAVDDLVFACLELAELPWWNDDSVTPQALFLRIHNDHDSKTAVVLLDLWLENLGGGAPI